jgi:hypothetical protein
MVLAAVRIQCDQSFHYAKISMYQVIKKTNIQLTGANLAVKTFLVTLKLGLRKVATNF